MRFQPRLPPTPRLSPQPEIRELDRSPMRIVSPSETRDVRFSPMTGGDHQEEVHFVVPSGSNGRLRVSVAWLRDRQRRRREEEGSEGIPPPLPPKGPSSERPHRDRNEAQCHISPRTYSWAFQSSLLIAPQSPPLPLQGYYNPYVLPLPAYSPPPRQPIFQMQQPMMYPQPGMPYGSWPRGMCQPPTIRLSSPLRPPSVEPPSSDGSPPVEPLQLPAAYPPFFQRPNPGPGPASVYPGQWMPQQNRQGREQQSIWKKMFGRQDQYPDRTQRDPISQWQRNVQAPSVAPTMITRGPMTAPMYREPRYRPPRSQKTAWWRPVPTTMGPTYERDAPRQQRRDQNLTRFRSHDERRKIRRDGSTTWDVFRRRTDEVHVRSPRRREVALPPSNAMNHIAGGGEARTPPIRRPSQARLDRSRPDRAPRPRLRERWSSRNWMNGNTDVVRDRPNDISPHVERQRQKAERRAVKSQKRSEREQRRRPGDGAGRSIFGGSGERRDGGIREGLFSGRRLDRREPDRQRVRDERRQGVRDGDRQERVRGNERVRSGRDMGMVKDWTRAISKFIPGKNDRRR